MSDPVGEDQVPIVDDGGEQAVQPNNLVEECLGHR
jgi:hypothetical protein